MSKVVRNYYTGKYQQKSMMMLLPLVEDDWKKMVKRGLNNTYLYCDGIEESIVDNFLLVEMKEGNKYEGNNHTKACYTTEDGTDILVYSLEHVAEDVQRFLSGEYSKYSDPSKKKLLEYYGHIPPPKPIDVKNGVAHQAGWYVILYPEVFTQEVSKEFFEKYEWYDTYKEAYDTVKGMKEMLGIFDLDKETLNKKIVE